MMVQSLNMRAWLMWSTALGSTIGAPAQLTARQQHLMMVARQYPDRVRPSPPPPIINWRSVRRATQGMVAAADVVGV